MLCQMEWEVHVAFKIVSMLMILIHILSVLLSLITASWLFKFNVSTLLILEWFAFSFLL